MTVLDLSGFTVPHVDLPRPLVDVSPQTREAMVNVVAAIVHRATPEDIAGHLTDGAPDWIGEALERPHEADEMNAMVDLLLYVMQTPADGR